MTASSQPDRGQCWSNVWKRGPAWGLNKSTAMFFLSKWENALRNIYLIAVNSVSDRAIRFLTWQQRHIFFLHCDSLTQSKLKVWGFLTHCSVFWISFHLPPKPTTSREAGMSAFCLVMNQCFMANGAVTQLHHPWKIHYREWLKYRDVSSEREVLSQAPG